MRQTSTMQKGFLFDYKWIPVLRDLEPKDFHIIFWQLLDFQQSGGSKKIPRHRGRRDLDYITNLLIPQIENRFIGAKGGRPPQRPHDPDGGSNPGSNPPTVPPTEGGFIPKISQVKLSQDKLSQVKVCEAETGASAPPATGGEDAISGEHAISGKASTNVDAIQTAATGGAHTQEKETEKGLVAQRSREAKRAYGQQGNVYLTPTQYKTLTETEGIPPAYIDRYSLRLTQGNYHPSDHASTLRTWWARDREVFTARASGGEGSRGEQPRDNACSGGGSSFDVDSFFEDAVRKSLGG